MKNQVRVALVIILLAFLGSRVVYSAEGDIVEREVYQPGVERDRTTRYQINRHFYKLQESDIGSHTLTVRLIEGTAESSERLYDIRDFDFEVQPVGTCEPPIITPLHPLVDTTLFNVFSIPQAFEEPSSSVLKEGRSEFLAFKMTEVLEPFYKPAFFSLVVGSASDVIFAVPDQYGNPRAFVYRDDGNLTFDDLIVRFYSSGLTQNDGIASEYLLPGNYLVAVTDGGSPSSSTVVEGNGFGCSAQICYEEEDMIFPLTVSSDNESLQLSLVPPKERVPPDFKSFAFKVSAPSGIESVLLESGDAQVQLSTSDGVIYLLDFDDAFHKAFYQYILFSDEPPNSIDITATANCTTQANLNLPLDIQPDPPPVATISAAIPQLELNYGEQLHISTTLEDPGLNVNQVRAVLFSEGATPDVSMLSLNNYQGSIVGEIGQYDFLPSSSTVKPLAVNSFNFQMPIRAIVGQVSLGSYDLRLLAFDGVGQTSVSDPIPTTILSPSVPPYLNTLLPTYRVPAGQDIPVSIEIEHLGPLDNLEISVTGAAENEAVYSHSLNGVTQFELNELFRVSETAQVGETVDISVTVTGQGGKTSSFLGQVEVGVWGERNIIVDSTTGNSRTDNSMRYANLVINATTLIHTDSSIRFNDIEINDGGILQAGSQFINDAGNKENEVLEMLELNGSLTINSGGLLEVAYVDSDNQGSRLVSNGGVGGSHGGDALIDDGSYRPAYGNVKTPRFPGGSGDYYIFDFESENVRASGGGKLEIIAESITLNGELAANGQNGFQLSSFRGSHAGAGGTLVIYTPQIDGTGVISVNGGNGSGTSTRNRASGAGGRIAIYYDNYADGLTAIEDGLTIEAFSGSASSGLYTAATGTVFLKQNSQSFGNLVVQPFAGYDGEALTSVPGIGRHTITVVESLSNDQYKITVSGSPWPLPNDAIWDTGLLGLQVSLDAATHEATLYTVLDNDQSSITVASTGNLSGIEGNELIGIYRFDHVDLGDGVLLSSIDRLYATDFSVSNAAALESVAEVKSDQIFELGQHTQNSGTQVYVGDVSADTFTMLNGEIDIFGTLTVIGDIALSSQSNLSVTGSITSSSLSLSGQAQANVGGSVTLENDLTLSGSADLKVDSDLSANALTLTEQAKLEVLGTTLLASNLSLSGDAIFSTGSASIGGLVGIVGNSSYTSIADLQIMGTLDLDEATMDIGGLLSVNGESSLVNSAALTADYIETQDNSDFFVETSSSLHVKNAITVSGVFAGATGSQIKARHIESQTMQLDGETARVVLHTESAEAGIALVLIKTDVKPFLDIETGITSPLLRLAVPTGTLLITAETDIDFSAVASTEIHTNHYPECSPTVLPVGSHGGLPGNSGNDNCVYDRFDFAFLPGSNASGSNERGGGVVDIEAQTATIDGQIFVNGHPNYPGAGGTIAVLADQLLGSGVLEAHGTGASGSASGGGRIVILTDNHAAFTGDVTAYGAESLTRIGGAGTVFFADPTFTTQYLAIDNNNQTAALNSTPIKAIGRHQIIDVNTSDSQLWELVVAGTPWKPSDSFNDIGVSIRSVSFDADNLSAKLYQVVSNSAYSLTIETTDDLSEVLGNDLIGIHTFETLQVTGGAFADFGEDRVIVNDLQNSVIDLNRINASPNSILQ